MIDGKQTLERVTDVTAIKKRIEDREINQILLSVVDASEFLTELVGEQVLDESTQEEILAGPTRIEINKRLFKWLTNTDDVSTFEMFLTKLRHYGQNHVANLLDGTPGELPLKTKVKQNIQKIMGELTKNIDPDSGLLEALHFVGSISDTAYEQIKADPIKTSRTRNLLNTLLRGSDKAFEKFVDELMKAQPLAMEILNKQEVEITKPHVELLKGNLDVLMRCTDINLLTIAVLRSEGVIDGSMEDGLKGRGGQPKITLMYDWLMVKPADVFQGFIRAMRENEQKHVANLLSKSLSGQLPMSSEKFDRLIRQRPHLMRGIHSKGIELASALLSEQAGEDTDFAISKTDYEDITQGDKTNTSRNSVLIDAILRRTDFSFDSLGKALRQTSQEHLADLLIEGEIVGAHVNTTRPDKEDDLSKLLNDLIANPKLYEENHDLNSCINEFNGFRLPIVATEAKHSIMVYTYCKTPEDMKTYVKLLNSGRLRTYFENILNQLLKKLEGENFQPLEAAVTLEEDDKILIQGFTGLDGIESDCKNLPFISNETCPSHGAPMNVYCFDCNMALCSSCIDQGHQSHKHSDVGKTPCDLREQLQQDLALISSCKSKSLQLEEKIEIDRKQFITEMEESEKAVLRKCEDLKQRVERFKEMLLQERAAYKQQILHCMDNKKRAIESYVAVYKDYEEYAKRLMEQGSPSDICLSFPGLHDRAEKLQQLPEPLTNKVFEKTNEFIYPLPQFPLQLVGVIPAIEMPQVQPQDIPQPQRNPIEQHRLFLESHIDPDCGLVEELVLSSKDAKKVRSEHTAQKKNAKLLDFISKYDKYKELITALTKTKQTHIVNALNTNGAYDPKFGDDWPLRVHEMQILETNRKYLVEKLQSRPLLDKLLSAEVISKKQKDFISGKPGFRERNEALLDILKRGSLDDYKKTVKCLVESNQSNIAQILAPIQGVAQSQVNVTIRVDVNKQVTELVASVNQLIASCYTF